MKTYLYSSRFKPNIYGHGGEKRSFQIYNFFLEKSIDLMKIEYYKPRYIPSFYELYIFIKLYFNYLIKIYSVFEFKKLLRIFQSYYLNFKNFKNEDKVLIWETNLGSTIILPFIAKMYNFKIIAFPHNIESLVPLQYSYYSKKNSPNWFNEEIFALKNCDEVNVISREENWLLNLFNIKSKYFPYKIPDEIINEMNVIRQIRSSCFKNKKDFLIFGTVTNNPTYLGFKKLLDFIKNEQDLLELKFFVAGYGSEKFFEYNIYKNISIIGSIEYKDLKKMLHTIKAIIINQEVSSGVLTRIPELLITGIPIICNEFAARSYYNTNNIYIYNNFNELKKYLNNINSLND